MTRPPTNVLELPLEDRAEMALRVAVEKVIIEHALSGIPMYVWREGKVIAMPIEELRSEAVRLQAE